MTQTLGQRLKELREGKGWTATELSYQSRVTQHTIGRIENDRVTSPQMSIMISLSEALGVTLESWIPYIKKQNQ